MCSSSLIVSRPTQLDLATNTNKHGEEGHSQGFTSDQVLMLSQRNYINRRTYN